MAKNTYKSNSFKKGNKPKKEQKPIRISFLTDRRFLLALGFFFVFTSFFLLMAFTSYLFTGRADQSIIQSIQETGIRPAGQEAANWLGLTGAWMAHYFIFEWFGLAAFLIIPLSFVVGHRFLFGKPLVALDRAFAFVGFFIVWISLLMGFLVFRGGDSTVFSFLSGGIGYELAVLFDSLVGWGTFIVLLLTLTIFVVFFFNVTHFFSEEEATEQTDTIEDETNTEKKEAEVEDESGQEENLQEDEEEMTLITREEEAPVNESREEAPATDSWKLDPEEEKKAQRKARDAADLELELEEKIEETEAPTDELEEEDEDLAFEVAESKEEKASSNVENYDPTLDLSSYRYPTLDMLNEHDEGKVKVTKEELEQNKDKIVETLVNFKIGISSIKATIGPTVTLYEIVPEAGVKISKIKNLEDDIALSLAALGIRIIAPIPGKGTIGIEVPNKNREIVSMKAVLSTDKFSKTDKELPIILGKTISNEVYLTDLSKMPHLLMAGATGQGKSVGLNVILASLLYKKHPSQLKFVLVDPKKVELTLFNKIERHFLAKLPNSEDAIITDTKKVIYTLNSLCIEMDNRYNLLKEASCRNLKEYNKKFISRRLNPENGHRYLPYIVLVIDELADLMMTAGKEIETPIARLAQLARAIGIHLVIATQRPSVNVITGIIKANFPARLSFRVTSKVDSRTILDAGGAEQLVGMGDMLLSHDSKIVRLQCPFLDTPEVEDVCDFIGNQRGYPDAYMLPEYEGEDEAAVGEVDLSERDTLFDDAARLIVAHQQGSTSLIQRKMKLGYNRAGRLIDQLEAAGIVGPFEGSKAREVLIQDEYSLEQLLNEIESQNSKNTY